MKKRKTNVKNIPWEIIFLSLLSKEDMYGSQIYNEMEAMSGGKFSLTTGAMYIILYKLSDNKYIEFYEKPTGRRRTMVYYHMTDEGRKKLEDLLKEFREQVCAIENLMAICMTEPQARTEQA